MAQTSTTGAVQGTVTDPQEAVVAGVEVKLLDQATNRSQIERTNNDGLYIFANVLPGIYTVTVATTGFRTAQVGGLKVEVNKSYTVNLSLEVGQMTEVAQVEAGVGAELQATDAQVGNVVQTRVLRNLPTSGRSTYATDPKRKIGRNYLIDFTIQRELPTNLIMEVGYIGRLGRDLPRGVDFDAAPYFFKDAASGQTFADAFDKVACALRGDAGKTFGAFTCPASVQKQPWFENQLPGLGTSFVATNFGSLFQTNAVSTLFLQMGAIRQTALGLPAYNNLQLLAISDGHERRAIQLPRHVCDTSEPALARPAIRFELHAFQVARSGRRRAEQSRGDQHSLRCRRRLWPRTV